MYSKVFKKVKVTLCSMALAGLFMACGSTANMENVESLVNNEVVKSTNVAETETTIGESEVNTETYIQYESFEPTIMYVINNTTGERYSTYHDPNVTEGELVASGLVDANQELMIDGKATLNGIDYYRIVFQEAMMLNHQIIIPAELITAKKQDTSVIQQSEAQQSVDIQQQQQPTETLPPTVESTIPEWNENLGVSKEDWDSFFGGGNTSGQRNWEPDYGEGTYIDENGNIWPGPGVIEDPSKIGSLIVQ